MSYTEEVYERVVAQNPGEPELRDIVFSSTAPSDHTKAA